MEIIAYCNKTCCPSISFNEKDPSQPILIADDFGGSVPLTLREFDRVSKSVGNIKRTNVFPTLVSDREFKINGYETDKPYISIELIDAIGNTRKVKDISFDHWNVFAEAINEHFAVA